MLNLITPWLCPQQEMELTVAFLQLLYQYTSLQVFQYERICSLNNTLQSSKNYFLLYSAWIRQTFSIEMHCNCFQHLNCQKTRRNQEPIRIVMKHYWICTQVTASDLELFPESHVYHTVSSMQQIVQSTFQENDTTKRK